MPADPQIATAELRRAEFDRAKEERAWEHWQMIGPVVLRPRRELALTFPNGIAALAWLKASFEFPRDGAGVGHRCTGPGSAEDSRTGRTPGPVAEFYRSERFGGAWACRIVRR